ncbi:kunitz-type protease inhibitor 4 [Chelonoidis abingdonii]|uniref:kunitz-type protease inhibitor 4 n=1 Tax=Chelonoidis abingdonii TaxID=106734 RepID=UPI0013F1F674|nr:eppin-like [Chelonoidis abingdonii]
MKSAGIVLLVALLSLWAKLPAASGGDTSTAAPAKDGFCYKVAPAGGVFDGENCAACLGNNSCSTCCTDADCPGSEKCCPDECGYTCQMPVTDLCHLPSVCGYCKARFPRWFYNWSSQACEEFVYGGCGGNRNNFETKEECLKACSSPGTA